MIAINLEEKTITFISSICGQVTSCVEFLELVDGQSYHLGTNAGVFLINTTESTINTITFTNSQDAIDFINNF